MTDYSKEPLGALGGRRREPEERMRVFLGCEKAPYGCGYDFGKGSVKLEYKHSNLKESNKHSSKQRRSGPTTRWQFLNLRGHGGKKNYNHLILEGEAGAEGNSYLFLISFKELSNSLPTLNNISVTLPMGGGKSRPLRKNSKFVWEHQVTREELRARVDEYARNSEDAESSLRAGILGEPDESAKNAKKNTRPDRNSPEGPRSAETKSTLQLPLPFKR
jgi:hypothetical protein